MQAYIANFDESLQLPTSSQDLILYFSGSDFRAGRIIHPKLFDFQSEHLIALKDVKSLILPSAKRILLGGGEPLLQRQAIAHISHFSFLPLVLYTLCTKPESLLYLMNRFSEIHVPIWYPLTDIFPKLTGAGTFFRPADAIMQDICQSYRILANYKGSIIVHVYAHEQFAQEDILSHINLIPWHELHLHANSDYFHGFDFVPLPLVALRDAIVSSCSRPVILHET